MAKHPDNSPFLNDTRLDHTGLDGAVLAQALAELSQRDPRMAGAIQFAGPLPERSLPRGFATLVKLVIEQQLSLIAAEAIRQKLIHDIGEITPDAVLSRDVLHLKSLGLGARKAEYVQGIARAVLGGHLDFVTLPNLSDADAMANLTAVRGVGPWTAEVYLLFAEGRCDLFPAGDVALQAAAHHAFDLPARPDVDQFRVMADAWRPWRSIAARVLWQVYRVLQEAKKQDKLDKAAK